MSRGQMLLDIALELQRVDSAENVETWIRARMEFG